MNKFTPLAKRLERKYGKSWKSKFRIRKNYPFGTKSKGRTILMEKNGGLVFDK